MVGAGFAGPSPGGLNSILQRYWTVFNCQIDLSNPRDEREIEGRRAALPGAAVLIISPILKYMKVLGKMFGCLNLAHPFPNVLDAEFG